MPLLNVKKIAALVFSWVMIQGVSAQILPDSMTRKIDSLFLKWNTGNSPGCTIGIIRNDSLIYARGYGMANLEYNIPNEPGTLYHMASISKQFAGWSMVLLARQGKIKLDDDVRKYLPWFPDLKQTITIRHLLNHASGIRDQWQLLAISGTRLDDIITQEHVIKLLGQQRALNFKPGELYSYSNSGFTMLAEIVKSVTGKTLRQFTDSAIFKPLGMANTHFHDDCTEIEKGRSYSYERKDSAHFANAVLSYSVAGATSLFTTINDMSKWVMHLYNTSPDNQALVKMLTQKGKLNNGKELSYANGIVVNEYKGWRQFSHGGADAGYRTYISVLPDKKMGFLVFSNLGDFDPGGKAYALADLFIRDTTNKKESAIPVLRDSAAAILKDAAVWQKYLGEYIGDDGLPLSFEVRYQQLHYKIYNETNFLIRGTNDTFSIPAAPEIMFVFSEKGKDKLVDVITPDQVYHLKKYSKGGPLQDKVLQEYTGTYFCPELDCSYGIIWKDHQLLLTNAKYPDVKLNVLGGNHLTNDNWWINHLIMQRDSNKKVTGFEVNSGGIMHLQFNKIK